MFRLTVLVTALFLCWHVSPAQASGALRSPAGPLRTAYTHVRVTLDGQTARTEVDQVFVNDLPTAVEASFAFPLPGDATVTGFADWRGGRRLEAAVAGREAAARAYDDALAAGKRVALGEVETERFRMHLDAIPARGSRRVSLSYVQSLDALGGARSYVFPGERDARPSVFDLEVEILASDAEHGATAVTTPNHADARLAGNALARKVSLNRTGRGLERDFVLRWQSPSAPLDLAARAGRRRVGEAGFVEARFAFDRDPFAAERAPRDVVIVVDASLSMSGEPLARARTLAQRTLAGLGDQDRVALLVVRDEVEPWIPALMPAHSSTVRAAAEGLERLRAGGRTDLGAALQAAGELIVHSEDAVVLLASDGQPTADASDTRDPFGLDVDAGLFGEARVVLAQLVWPRRGAELARLFPNATVRYLPDGPAGDGATDELVRLVTAPVLEELTFEIEGPGVHDVSGLLPTRLSQGETVRLLARADGPTRIRVEGLLHGIPVGLTAEVRPEASPTPSGELLAVEWARTRVAELEATLSGADGPTREIVGEEIRGLGLTYGIATRMTSFVTAPTADSLGPDRIKPGDPEIRVRAPRNTMSVIGVLPWGEVVPCTWDETESLWLGRFLVPRGAADGLYRARILLRMQAGWVSRGTLFFRVDSAPPTFELTLETLDGLPVGGPGETDAPLRFVARPADHVFDDDGMVNATDGDGIVRDRLDLKRILVRVGDRELPLERSGAGERWEAYLPDDLPSGRHTARLVAVDYALNSTETTLELEVP
jgi:Ca-activated chloride channel family protein